MKTLSKTFSCAVLAMGLLSTGLLAQDPAEPRTDTTRPYDSTRDRDRDHNFGWVGLLGLAGLAGLMRPGRRDTRDTRDTGVR